MNSSPVIPTGTSTLARSLDGKRSALAAIASSNSTGSALGGSTRFVQELERLSSAHAKSIQEARLINQLAAHVASGQLSRQANSTESPEMSE